MVGWAGVLDGTLTEIVVNIVSFFNISRRSLLHDLADNMRGLQNVNVFVVLAVSPLKPVWWCGPGCSLFTINTLCCK